MEQLSGWIIKFQIKESETHTESFAGKESVRQKPHLSIIGTFFDTTSRTRLYSYFCAFLAGQEVLAFSWEYLPSFKTIYISFSHFYRVVRATRIIQAQGKLQQIVDFYA